MTIFAKNRLMLLAAAMASFVLYFLTCFRTFTWWDSSDYAPTALLLGISSPPGSLLTVIAGWMATRLPLGIDKFFLLNLLTSLMAALTVYIIGRLGIGLYFQDGNDDNRSGPAIAPYIGAFLGALAFGVSATTWYYAIRFTPYMTTALMTSLIVLAMLAWRRHSSDDDAHLWLGLVTLLFGLDFSVHRTNLLLLPALLIWVMIFYPKTFLSIKSWVYGLIGLAAGGAVHLLIIPIAARQPFINFGNPSSLARFWDYIRLQQFGGGWLINIYPRKAAFFGTQVADYIKIFGDNFANSNFAYLGFLPLVVGLAGLAILFRRNWRLGLGLSVLFIFASFGAILYFNLPANYFRSIDRHYMPSFVIFAIFIVYGAAVLMRQAASLRFRLLPVGVAIMMLLAAMPAQAIKGNFHAVDGSKSYFAYDTAKNYLAYLPKDAIFITQSDIDTFPLWCLQIAEKMRPDITVCNINLMNTSWFIEQLQLHDEKFPVKLSKKELAALAIIPWHDSTISVNTLMDAMGSNNVSDTTLRAQITFQVTPSIEDKYLLIQDQMLLKIIEANNWCRPICFSTMLPESSLQWLRPYLRLEGLYWRLVPSKSDVFSTDILRENLMENYSYRNYSDRSIFKEEATKWVAWNYCSSFLMLSSMQYSIGDTAGCRNTMDQLQRLIAPERLSPPPQISNALMNACR